MDRTAIEAIAEYTTAPNLTEITDIPAIVIPEKNKVESLEHLLAAPARFVAHYQTSLLDEYAGYCNKHSDIESAIFINPEKMNALAIFDLGDEAKPAWGKHRATLSLKKTAAFEAVLDKDRSGFDQQGLIDFVNDWDDCITFFDENAAEIPLTTAINRIRRLTVSNLKKSDSEVGNFNAQRTAMESIEVSAGNDKPPASIHFSTKPYNGFDDIVLRLDVRAVVKHDAIALQYRIAGLDSLMERLSDDFKQKLMAALPEAIIYIGDIAYR